MFTPANWASALGSLLFDGDGLICTLSLFLLAITQNLEDKNKSWQPTVTRLFLE